MAIKRTETRMRTGSPRRAAMRILRMRRTRRHHTNQQRLCPLSITRYKYSIKNVHWSIWALQLSKLNYLSKVMDYYCFWVKQKRMKNDLKDARVWRHCTCSFVDLLKKPRFLKKNQTWTQDTLNEIIATFHVIALHISDANFVNKLRSFYNSSLIYVL